MRSSAGDRITIQSYPRALTGVLLVDTTPNCSGIYSLKRHISLFPRHYSTTTSPIFFNPYHEAETTQNLPQEKEPHEEARQPACHQHSRHSCPPSPLLLPFYGVYPRTPSQILHDEERSYPGTIHPSSTHPCSSDSSSNNSGQRKQTVLHFSYQEADNTRMSELCQEDVPP